MKYGFGVAVTGCSLVLSCTSASGGGTTSAGSSGSSPGVSLLPGASCSTGYDCGAPGALGEGLMGFCCRQPSVTCGSDTDCCLGHCQDHMCACLVDGEPCPAI